MRLLLDTQLLIWAAMGSPRLSRAARAAITDPAAEIVFSVLSVWEVAIKHSLRRGDIPIAPDTFREALLGADWEELPIFAHHTIAVVDLPLIHGDPFDRLLVAQAQVEGMTLLTVDKTLGTYGNPVRVV